MSNFQLSKRVQSIPPSAIRRFFDLANEMKDEVLSLSIGEPDFVTPWVATDAGICALEHGVTHYSPNMGYMALRQAISDYLHKRYGVYFSPKTQVLCTVGGSEGIDMVMRGLLDPGDEVIIPEPCFVAYRACTLLSGGTPISIDCSPENGFKLTAEALEAAITSKTKLLVVGYPNNPTGAVMFREDWDQIAAVLRRHPHVYVLTDELYTELDYSGKPASSLIQYPDLAERVLYIGGFSKAYAMTGWRIGYVCAGEEAIAGVNRIHQYTIMSAPSVGQMAALDAMLHAGEQVEMMRDAYNSRRNVVCSALQKMGLPIYVPQGAFYVFPNITVCGMDSNTFCERFLQEEKVAIIPGSAFGACGEGYARISYAAAMETIEEAMVRLARFVARHAK